jgi:hypothetical protein
MGQKARTDPGLVSIRLYHPVWDVELLRACVEALPANRAVGTGGTPMEQSGATYEAPFEASSHGYRPGSMDDPGRTTEQPRVNPLSKEAKGSCIQTPCHFAHVGVVKPGFVWNRRTARLTGEQCTPKNVAISCMV